MMHFQYLFDLLLYFCRNVITLSKLKYLNVSRHHYDDEENRRVFGDRSIPGLDEITGIFGLFGGKPLEFRLNCTLYPDADAEFVTRYIQAAAGAGISSILFRSDYFSRPEPALSDMFRNLLNGRPGRYLMSSTTTWTFLR